MHLLVFVVPEAYIGPLRKMENKIEAKIRVKLNKKIESQPRVASQDKQSTDLEDSGDEQPVPLQILLVIENVAVSQVCHQCFLCVLNTPHAETQFIGNIIIIIYITSSGEKVVKRL